MMRQASVQQQQQQPWTTKSVLCNSVMSTITCSSNSSTITARSSSSSSSSLPSVHFSLQSIQEDKDRYGHLSSFLVATDALHGAIDKAARHRPQLEGGGGRRGGRLVKLSRASSTAPAAKECNDAHHENHGEFLNLLEAEIGRVTQTISSQLKDQELSAKALLNEIDDILLLLNSSDDNEQQQPVDEAKEATAATTLYLRAKANELCDLCLKLQAFVARNAALLEQVAARADAELIGTSCTSYVNRRLAVSPWNEGPNSALLVVLSDIYNDIRKLEAKAGGSSSSFSSISIIKKWIAPSTFERRTLKYFVREDKLTELLLAAVAEAPLLIYGKSGRLTSSHSDHQTRAVEGGDKLWDSSLAAPISSVYFDSPATMCMYKERIQRLEGAQLFRIRWYGTTKPQGDELVFLELKTHHEEWIIDQSVKERVNIQEKDVCRFLSPNSWTLEVAKELVLRATPTLNGDSRLARQVELLQKMHHLVVTKGLRPCIRSMYNRVAFQSPDSNALRLTLDRNVTLIDETQIGVPWTSGTWCLPDDAVITDTMISHVPYSVFEVKLCNSEMPSVFQHLVDTGTLMEKPKFSKFITGAAAFNASRVANMLLPYWAEDPGFQDLILKGNTASCCDREDTNNNNNELRSVKSTSSESSETTSLGHKINVTDMHIEVSSDAILDGNDTPFLNSQSSPPSNFVMRNEANGSNNDAIHVREGGSSFLLRRRPPTTEQQNATESSNKMFDFVRTHKKSSETPIQIAPKKLARVEPKSYFANERTFIQWISAALLLITVSVILLDFQSVNGIPSTAGLILNVCAIVIIIYSMFSYYRRLKLLQKAANYGYVDHIGPIILGLAVLLGVLTLLSYYITRTMQVNNSSSSLIAGGNTLMADPGKCVQHPIIGTSSLQYQPSGVVVNKDRHLLLVPSLDRITALSTATPDLPMETLVVIPGSDLEALTYVGDRLFALGEGQKSLALFELGWNRSSSALFVKQQWELETSANSVSAEGLVYIPDPNDASGGSLYVAGDNFNPDAPQDRGMVYMYDIPPAMPVATAGTTETTTKIQRKGILNSNLLNLDLVDATTGIQLDSKIGDLHYFDGVLYVLHDNAEVIRAWDAASGDLLATMRLPRVFKNFSNRQWEGMALEHITGSDPSSRDYPSLRGGAAAAESPSPPSTLTLHLALDTPPQVWSFSVAIPSRGSIVFPSCAAAY